MDVLKNKSYKQYPYISRYSGFPFYYNTLDKKYIYGITKQLSLDTPYVLHKVTQTDTLDSLSLQYYGRPDLYWVIADFNRIQDSYIKLSERYETLKIPSISSIVYED